MEGEHVAVIDVADHVAVGENDVFLTGVVQETGDGREVFHAAVRDGACVAEGRQDEQALSLAGEIPRLAGAEVVHQGLIVVLGDNADLVDAGVDHIGKRKIDQAVAAAEGHRAHGALFRQLADFLVVLVGEQNSQHIIRTHYFVPSS